MKIDAIETPMEALLNSVKKHFDDDWRLVTVTCVDEGERVRLLYSFDRNLALENLELCITREQEVPSISSIYPSAFLVENEIKDLFGLKITDMSLDLNGRLYMVQGAKEAPMSRTAQPAGKGEA